MFRKTIIAAIGMMVLGAAAMPTEALARWQGGWHGGWRGPGWGFYGTPYAYGPGPYYGRCYQVRRVPTPYGLRWRRVWVCG